MMERKDDVDTKLENIKDDNKALILNKIRVQGKHFQTAIKPILQKFNRDGILDW